MVHDHDLPRAQHALRERHGVHRVVRRAAAGVADDMCVAGPEPEQRRRVHPGIHAGKHGELHPRLDDPGVHAEVMEPRIQDHLVDRVHCQQRLPFRRRGRKRFEPLDPAVPASTSTCDRRAPGQGFPHHLAKTRLLTGGHAAEGLRRFEQTRDQQLSNGGALGRDHEHVHAAVTRIGAPDHQARLLEAVGGVDHSRRIALEAGGELLLRDRGLWIQLDQRPRRNRREPGG